MHTSTILHAEHFTFCRPDGSAASFADFCPGYAPQDRVGIVAPTFDEGVTRAGLATLALTTAFYDAMRRLHPGETFFDYPTHFCLVDRDARGVSTPRGRIAGDLGKLHLAWSNLDVWPECKWIAAGTTPADMLRAAFNLQIERLFWPEGWGMDTGGAVAEDRLPEHALRMMRTRLKSVWCYGTDRPTVRVFAAEPARQMVRTSAAQLPGVGAGPAGADDTAGHAGEPHRDVSVREFFDKFAWCFARA